MYKLIILVAFIILSVFLFMQTKSSYSFTSIVVIGCAKDVSKYLPKTKENIDMICSLFEKSNVFIYENDSTDNTLEQLLKWKNAEIITEKNVKGPRTVRLAHGRNLLMKKALECNSEYIVVIDMDDITKDLTKDSFLSSFNDSKFIDWACIGANQNGYYYDIWALRTFDDWMPFDFPQCCRETNKDQQYCFSSRFKNIPKDKDPIKVKSCFGGLAIYKTKCIRDSEYIGLNKDGYEVCEHVSFNEGITDGNIYINPAMIIHR